MYIKKNLDQKFGLDKKLEQFSEKKKFAIPHLTHKINQISLKIPLRKSSNLTLISKGKTPKSLYLRAQTELSELPVHEHIKKEL